MNYNYIINPKTNRKVLTYGKVGKKIIKKYLYILGGGARSRRNNFLELFELVKYGSFKLRIEYKDEFDGAKFWKGIKNKLKQFDDKIASKGWKKIKDSIREKYMGLEEFTKQKIIIEEHHFLIQQVRIPLNEKPTIRKGIQIALNIGQFLGNPSQNLLNEYKKLPQNLMSIKTYFNDSDIEEFSELISNELILKIKNYIKKYKL